MPRGALLPSGSSPHSVQDDFATVRESLPPESAYYASPEAETAHDALDNLVEQYGLLERQLAAAEGGWQRAQELQEQLETAQTRLREAHDQLCGCDHPTNPSRCSAPEETWGAFEGLGVRARVSTPAVSPFLCDHEHPCGECPGCKASVPAIIHESATSGISAHPTKGGASGVTPESEVADTSSLARKPQA